MIKQRVGQGFFRDKLLARWNRQCALTLAGVPEMLIASHIKPWSRCQTPAERLGDSNGLLLAPSIDKAFDRGLISFDQKFQVVCKPHFMVAASLPRDHTWDAPEPKVPRQ